MKPRYLVVLVLAIIAFALATSGCTINLNIIDDHGSGRIKGAEVGEVGFGAETGDVAVGVETELESGADAADPDTKDAATEAQ